MEPVRDWVWGWKGCLRNWCLERRGAGETVGNIDGTLYVPAKGGRQAVYKMAPGSTGGENGDEKKRANPPGTHLHPAEDCGYQFFGRPWGRKGLKHRDR